MYSVPGKRRRASAKSSKDWQPPQKKGRSLKHPSQLRPSRNTLLTLQRQHQSSFSNAEPATGQLSLLECLPNELIQQIFFLSLEVNLPRASQHLTLVLSTESTFRALILFAYFDDDESHPVESKLFAPADYRRLNLAEKVRLQIEITKCRWWSYARMKACLPALGRLRIVQEWYRERHEVEQLRKRFGSDFGIVGDHSSPNSSDLPDLHDYDRLHVYYMAGSSEPWDHESELPRIVRRTYNITDITDCVATKLPSAGGGIFCARVIPSWLLENASQADENVRFLAFLRQGFESIEDDAVMELSIKSIFQGISNAIENHHLEALTTLLELQAALRQIWQDGGVARHQRQQTIPPPLPLSLFHLATQQQGNSSELMRLLARHNSFVVPHNDQVITAWAVQWSSSGDSVAQWFLAFMAGQSHSIDELSLGSSQRTIPWTDRTPTERLG